MILAHNRLLLLINHFLFWFEFDVRKEIANSYVFPGYFATHMLNLACLCAFCVAVYLNNTLFLFLSLHLSIMHANSNFTMQ